MTRFEYSFIGCMVVDSFWLREPEKMVDAMDMVRREYFSTDLGKVIFSAVLKVLQQEALPDVDLIDQLLAENMIYKNFDGRHVLMDAAKDTTSFANVIKYAENVRGDHFARDAQRRIEESSAVIQGSGSPKDRIEKALGILGGISLDYDTTRQDTSFKSAFDDMCQHMTRVAELGSRVTGVDTGYIRLNEITHGLQDGNTIVVAGTPGGGKTTFCLNLMTHAAFNANKKVLFYSLEMPRHEIAMKVSSLRTRLPISAFQNATVITNDTDFGVLGATFEGKDTSNFHIDDDASITAESIENRTKQHAMRMGGIDLICIDYLTLMDAQGESETVRATNAAKACKRLAKKFNCPVIIISQFVKNVVGRPTKADLRQTGQLGQDASLIALLYRDPAQLDDNGKPPLIELIIDKNRMGETGTIMFEAEFQYNRMNETDREIAYPLDKDGNPVTTQRAQSRIKVVT